MNIRFICAIMLFFTAIQSSIKAVPDRLHDRWTSLWKIVDNATSLHDVVLQKMVTTFKEHDMLLGAASSEYQILGAKHLPNSSMAYGETEMGLEPSGHACGGWDQHVKDIALLKACGFKTYRFSVDWSAIELQPGMYDENRLTHYRDFCAELVRQGIKPMVTLHHFVHPQWFERLGAFEREANIEHFVRFSQKVYDSLGEYVDLWCTINEPGIYMFQSYMRGVFPPFKSISLPWVPAAGLKDHWSPADRSSYGNLEIAGRVLRNLLLAHVCTYEALKDSWKAKQHVDGGFLEPQIGFAHQYLTFYPFHGGYDIRGVCERQIAQLISSWINGSIMTFFKTGTFAFAGASAVNFRLPRAIKSLDFIGLNYYSCVFMDMMQGFKPNYYDEDIQTDMPYGIYAEGFYAAIADVARLGCPIHITENGIADRNDTNRELWIKRHLYVVARALEEGHDVRGYYYWSLLDNWEWDMGYQQKFGLYHVDFATQQRTLRPGSYILRDIAHAVAAGC